MDRERTDDDREVVVDDEDTVVLPDRTRDDAVSDPDAAADSNDDRLWAERPPHWD